MKIALILSGGVGSRAGEGIPKQYREVGGRPMISYCLKTFAEHDQIDAIHIVADEKWQEFIRNMEPEICSHEKWRGFSLPGKNRQLSILNGLEKILKFASEQDLVMIHDAARPLVTAEQISACLAAAEGHDGVMPALPMKDTVYYSEDGNRISGLLDRSRIFAGQAPEVFSLGSYYRANQKLLPDQILEIRGSSEPAVLAGLDIVMLPGDERNYKITTQEDLRRFAADMHRSSE